jgi:GH15 family glucan-1,4-alpha-glucosidase
MNAPASPISARIEDYALIGDCETAALVSREGSIDWLCWPRFDSAACFAALLGAPQHGRWCIAPAGACTRQSRRYRDGTLILETDFETAEGAVTLIDFMPPRGNASDLFRIVVGRRGTVQMATELVLRFGYGSSIPWVTRLADGTGLRAIAGPDMVLLHSDVPLQGKDLTTVGQFSVRAGEQCVFVLSYAPSHERDPVPLQAQEALVATEHFWRQWSGACAHEGEWREAVVRSHITLKALTYAPTGGIVAAPTTSLPEHLGGVRNWDYRFCWLRDATLALVTLVNAGYREEAAAWRDWLLRAVAGSPQQMQIMYGVAGERRLPEWEVPWLPGYEGSRPVRIGNAAHDQFQLDVYGELANALYQARCAGLVASDAGWALERALLDHVGAVWDQPDEGIWEVRGGRRHFTHSKVMAWVAVDRALRSAEAFGLEGPLDRWRGLRSAMHEDICRRGFDATLGSFVQSYGSRQLDASLLMIPLVGFLDAADPRMRGTVAAIERGLVRDGFVLRYDTGRSDDGLPPGEGAFLACSFWLVENLVLQGRVAEGRALFERLLALRNDVGLLAEEYDPRHQRQLGNFPQAFSHLALADAARCLNLALRHPPAGQAQPGGVGQAGSLSA